jgi:hypothetical protein
MVDAAAESDRLSGLMVVVTGVILVVLRLWALHGCTDCVIPA